MSEWHTIDTAPKDGTRILLARIVGHPAHATALWWATAGHWSTRWKNWNDGVEPSGLADPNYWMPLTTAGAIIPDGNGAESGTKFVPAALTVPKHN